MCIRDSFYSPRPWACPARKDSARRQAPKWSDLGMKPVTSEQVRRMDRRVFLGMGLGGLAVLAGCKSPLTRGQTPEADELKVEGEEGKDKRDLVGSYTRPFGLNKVNIE